MFTTSGASHQLGFAALLLVLAGCGEQGFLPQTRPSALARPVASCAIAKPKGALQLPTWDLYVVAPDWDALHEDVEADVEVDAQLCIDGTLEPVELELQGGAGRRRDKKSFKIKFERDHDFSELGFEGDDPAPLDKVYLKAVWIDPSMIREAVAFDLWRELGHDAPRISFANLRINGDYWGLYTLIEPVDDDYLERNGYPAGGRLYKATRKYGSRADFAPGRDLIRAFEDKSDDPTEARDELEQLTATLQETALDEASFGEAIDPIFRLDEYIDRMVWVSLTGNADAIAANYFLYKGPPDDAPWQLIPWDSDLCMGSNWRDPNAALPSDAWLLLDGGSNHFASRLTMVPGLRERYVERFLHVLDEVLPEPVVSNLIDKHAARVRRDLTEDQLRWPRTITPDEAIDEVHRFAAARPAILRLALDTTFTPPAEQPATTVDTEDLSPLPDQPAN